MVELLVCCLVLVEKVGEVKSLYGLFIYVFDREVVMFVFCRVEVEKKGVFFQLIEDILCCIMCEFYVSEKDLGFKCLNFELCLVVIIGGNGQLGGLFGCMFKLFGY